MEKSLWKIFANVNFWLHYAERKNAILVTLIGLQLTLFKAFGFETNFAFVLSVVLLFASFLIAALSFFPETHFAHFLSDRLLKSYDSSSESNPVFFGHISNWSSREYVEKLEKLFDEKIQEGSLAHYLCQQISANSSITNEKFKAFKLGLVIFCLGQFLFLISLFIK